LSAKYQHQVWQENKKSQRTFWELWPIRLILTLFRKLADV
jgi:hypothetical protein